MANAPASVQVSVQERKLSHRGTPVRNLEYRELLNEFDFF
jgi:hypothetical protein